MKHTQISSVLLEKIEKAMLLLAGHEMIQDLEEISSAKYDEKLTKKINCSRMHRRVVYLTQYQRSAW